MSSERFLLKYKKFFKKLHFAKYKRSFICENIRTFLILGFENSIFLSIRKMFFGKKIRIFLRVFFYFLSLGLKVRQLALYINAKESSLLYDIVLFHQILVNISNIIYIGSFVTNRKIVDLSIQFCLFLHFIDCRVFWNISQVQ